MVTVNVNASMKGRRPDIFGRLCGLTANQSINLIDPTPHFG